MRRNSIVPLMENGIKKVFENNKVPFTHLIREFNRKCNLCNLSKKTIVSYDSVYNKFFDYLSSRGISYLEDMTKEVFEAYVLHLIDESPLQAKRFVKYWRTFKKRLSDFDFPNYDASIGTIKTPKTLRKVYTDEEVQMILDAFDKNSYYGYRTYVMVIMMVTCGMRVDEIINLEIKNLDFIEHKIDLKHTKGMKERMIPMCFELEKLLKDYIYIRNDTDEPIKNDYLFLSKTNEQMTYSGLKCYFRDNIVPKVKLGQGKTFGFHNYRRKYATDFMKKNGNISKLQYLLGHSDPGVTMNCYVILSESDISAEEAKANNFF